MAILQYLIYFNAISTLLVPFVAVYMAGLHYYKWFTDKEYKENSREETIFPFGVFCIVAVISSVLSYFRNISVPMTLGFFIVLFGMYNYMVYLLTKQNATKVMKLFTSTSIIPAVVGVLQFIIFSIPALKNIALMLDLNYITFRIMIPFFGDVNNSFHAEWVSLKRVYSTFVNPNLYANYLIFVIIFGIYFAFSLKDKREKLYFSSLTIVNFVLLLLTGSRAGYLGILFGVLFYIILRYSKPVIIIAVICSTILLGYITINPDIIPRYDTIQASFADRISIWKAAYAYFVDHILFGIGFGTFGKNFILQYKHFVVHAHNIYFGLLSEFGIIGFLVFFWWIFQFVDRTRLLIKQKNKRMMSLWASLVGFFTQGILDYPLYGIQNLITFFIVICLMTAWIKQESPIDKEIEATGAK